MKFSLAVLSTFLFTTALFAAETVVFNARTAQSGKWSDAQTWDGGRKPQADDFVQIRAGHVVTYDVNSTNALRMLHVAGTLAFSREISTLLDVGLIKVEPVETTTEDGFNCHDEAPAPPAGTSLPVLEIGTLASPIPAGVKATIRLRHFKGTDSETLPAIINCGGRWEVHGAPMNRTWLKLAAPARVGDVSVTVEQPVSDWHVGDRIIITTGDAQGPETGHTFRKGTRGRQKPVGTEERVIKAIAGAVLTLDRALAKAHHGAGLMRCEVANLSRNVVIESADPAGTRGHTMYHRGSSGGISYAEFRHLGKEGVLGKYPIHFHLVRDTMRGSGVLGASIWDSHNRWVTIHGTDHMLIRDCVGYQSRGHGFFLEDATEQWNVLDRNLAVQSFGSVPLPQQVLSFDPNDGAGFWWANGRNTFTRNVACENDRYGFHFQIAKTSDFNPVRSVRSPDG
ncbi:MAG TPA: G8 domain-containing protein, partial [Methylomirabilota bacterium]|nr:G8 domain-containing protein [Methylomirabilota bacterium]